VRIRWLKGGTKSFRLIHAHLALDNPAAARRVVQRIRTAVTRLRTFPASGRTGEVPGTMELIIPGVSYVVVYRITSDEVEILRVFHTSQNRSGMLQ
jgi:toxin ParE1/3/4